MCVSGYSPPHLEPPCRLLQEQQAYPPVYLGGWDIHLMWGRQRRIAALLQVGTYNVPESELPKRPELDHKGRQVFSYALKDVKALARKK